MPTILLRVKFRGYTKNKLETLLEAYRDMLTEDEPTAQQQVNYARKAAVIRVVLLTCFGVYS